MGNLLVRRAKIAVPALALAVAGMCLGLDGADAAEPPSQKSCEKIVLTGEVSAGHAWKAAIGEGWVFRVLPIPQDKSAAGVGGWDLVVDREEPAGFPDALLLATPPYNLINSREIGTTFGLRAQDAIGWNPRHFRFLTNRNVFRQEQRLYLFLDKYGEFGGKGKIAVSSRKERALKRAMQRFVKLARESSPGRFQILDAHLMPGAGNVKPYATNWAQQSAETPHTDVVPPGASATPLGNLQWMRFSVTLWVPSTWRVPKDVAHSETPCPK